MQSSRDPIEQIKERLDIVEVIGRKVALKKTGRTLKGLCPFHGEKTPSFVVYPDEGQYHCFGCGASGDVFTFVMKTESLDFAEALSQLAERAGVTLPTRRPPDAGAEQRAKLVELLGAATIFYQQCLRAPEGAAARQYLESRAIAADSIDRFQLGWAPEGWDHLFRHLTERGALAEDLLAAGLVSARETGGYYDRMRARLIFPIKDERGDVVGFGGRTLGSEQPKYLNSPQTALFDKGASLYGIDQAKASIRAMGRATIVEGYVDAVVAHQHGFKDVVASLGTALTDRQLGILKRLTKTIVLALDSDAAGDEAMLRGLEVTRQVFADDVQPVISPRGLVRLERRLSADILIATLPRGRDPDDVIREDPARWGTLVGQAKPIVEFSMDAVLGRADLSSAKGTAEAARKLLPVIAEVSDQIQQAHYLQQLAQRVRIPEPFLRSEMNRQRLAARVPEAERPAQASAPRRHDALDENVLGLVLRYPRANLGTILDEVTDNDWALVESRQAAAAIRTLLRSGQPPTLAAVQAQLPDALAEWLEAVYEHQAREPELSDERALLDLRRTVVNMRRRRRRQESARIGRLLTDLEGSEDGEEREQIGDLVRLAERELTELATDEQNSAMALNWRATPPSS